MPQDAPHDVGGTYPAFWVGVPVDAKNGAFLAGGLRG